MPYTFIIVEMQIIALVQLAHLALFMHRLPSAEKLTKKRFETSPKDWRTLVEHAQFNRIAEVEEDLISSTQRFFSGNSVY